MTPKEVLLAELPWPGAGLALLDASEAELADPAGWAEDLDVGAVLADVFAGTSDVTPRGLWLSVLESPDAVVDFFGPGGGLPDPAGLFEAFEGGAELAVHLPESWAASP